MKITGLEIKDFRQFQDLKLDFTYPKGHKLEGQPLKKVCFIGQSGTGKTTLLETLIISSVVNSKGTGSFFHLAGWANSLQLPSFILEKAREMNNMSFTFLQDGLKSTFTILDEKNGNIQPGGVFLESKFIIYLAENKVHFLENIPSYLSFFSVEDANSALKILLEDIEGYRKKENNFRLNISSKILEKNEIGSLQKEYEKWLLDNPSPVETLANECLDGILNKFFLKTKRKLETVEELKLHIQHAITDQTFQFEDLSTGTRQIITTAIPLFNARKDENIVIFDEPERSLFPDIQRDLIKYYTNLAPNSQFFFATHSPIIASQFEPCERFILKFKQDGKVSFINGIAPEGDDPNDMLLKDFGLDSILGEKGKEELEKYIELKGKIKFSADGPERDKLIEEYMELQKEYNFSGTNEKGN